MYRSLFACVQDLQRQGQLRRVPEPIDPDLVMAHVHRRVCAAGGPAVLFERVIGSDFPAVCNLYGTVDRARWLFRDTLPRVRQAIAIKADPVSALRRPWRYLTAPLTAWWSLPRRVGTGPVLASQTTIGKLPAVRSWPRDGGPFITLPQVYTEPPDVARVLASNLGMYRVQLCGNEYEPDAEVGLHYQIHRGIGAHHAQWIEAKRPMPVSIFVGGPPAHAFAAVMPLPEGLSELVFAGMLAGRRFRYARVGDHVVSTDADFCILGYVDPDVTKPEGPFGDHLGYYSLRHDFPVLRVHAVYHRPDAIWPFTVVGRPPQEDTAFGALIHELVAPMVPVSIAGLVDMHAVDAAGVHPLLFAIGRERYVPYGDRIPREILTVANAILGFSQASLAKYVFIAAHEDAPGLSVHDVGAMLDHVLARFDPTRDLHFQTRTTIDTLDYSGTGLNTGSKLVWAAAGAPRRTLATELPALPWPDGFSDPRLARPGIVVVRGPAFDPATGHATAAALGDAFARAGVLHDASTPIALVVIVDDPDPCARRLDDLLWVTFTRSNPSHDVHGVGASVEHKHWGCRGAVIIDARIKPHHAPPLVDDPEATRKADALFARGGPLHGIE